MSAVGNGRAGLFLLSEIAYDKEKKQCDQKYIFPQFCYMVKKDQVDGVENDENAQHDFGGQRETWALCAWADKAQQEPFYILRNR
ncbi:MAG: hypothetical protein HFI35_09450 [Roseburia sp.]|nr:hypothetical protein [Roseburia sp.]